MSTTESEEWVEKNMVPVFPLGVKKDIEPPYPFKLNAPDFTSGKLINIVGGRSTPEAKHCKAFPSHIAPKDIAMKLAGSGGDGAQTAAMLIVQAGINEGYDATHIPSYGPESRGGTSYADVHIAEEEVLSPASPHPNILIAFNRLSLVKFGPEVVKGGTIIYDSGIITDAPSFDGVKMVGVPFAEIANDLGKVIVKNIVALGALQAATNLFPAETLLTAIRMTLKDKCALIPLNEQAFEWGVKTVKGK